MQKHINLVDLVKTRAFQLVKIFIFQSLSVSLFLNLLFEQDSYSNEYLLFSIYMYLVAKFGFDTAENEPLEIWTGIWKFGRVKIVLY